MGGLGSGKRRERPTVEDCLELSVSLLTEENLLADGVHRKGSFAWPEGEAISFEVNMRDDSDLWLRLAYKTAEETVDLVVKLETTSPYFGGVRYWFICENCQRRSGKLYLPTGENHFRCRLCHRLVYEAQRESRGSRMLRKAGKIRHRLGGNPSDPLPERPKGMHRRTFQKLMFEAISAEKESLTAAVERFGA